MTNKEKMEILEEVFDCDAEELSESMVLADMDSWDSMTKLSLIVAMDEHFGKALSGTVIATFKTVGDILAYMD